MKANIHGDGLLDIIAENDIETYALMKWQEAYDSVNNRHAIRFIPYEVIVKSTKEIINGKE